MQILHRRAGADEQETLRDEYAERFLTPWQAAERGFVDAVIDPDDTRAVVAGALRTLATAREHVARAQAHGGAAVRFAGGTPETTVGSRLADRRGPHSGHAVGFARLLPLRRRSDPPPGSREPARWRDRPPRATTKPTG